MNFKKLAIGIMAFGFLIIIVYSVDLLSTKPLEYKPNTNILKEMNDQADLFLRNRERENRRHQAQKRMPIGTILIIVGLIIFVSAKKK